MCVCVFVCHSEQAWRGQQGCPGGEGGWSPGGPGGRGTGDVAGVCSSRVHEPPQCKQGVCVRTGQTPATAKRQASLRVSLLLNIQGGEGEREREREREREEGRERERERERGGEIGRAHV